MASVFHCVIPATTRFDDLGAGSSFVGLGLRISTCRSGIIHLEIWSRPAFLAHYTHVAAYLPWRSCLHCHRARPGVTTFPLTFTHALYLPIA